VVPDPKWLEILKASGWQTTAVALALGLFWVISTWGWIPPLEPWMARLVALGFLLCACLSAASILSALNKFFMPGAWIKHWIENWREARRTEDYIRHMTETERKIIAHLLAHNQKMFTCDQDGGYAATLISKKIVVYAIRPGQVFDVRDTPFAIPDHVWKVLQRCKNQFPYQPPARGQNEGHPWRVPWMVR
jgi:hypothetical protein